MTRIALLFCFTLFSQFAWCQNSYMPDSAAVKLYGKDYCKAEFPTCADGLQKFITKNLQYPEAARENNIEGRVRVRFLVGEDGAISRIIVLRGIGGDCDEEAKRVVSSMPRWSPATYNKRPIRAVETLAVVFKLE